MGPSMRYWQTDGGIGIQLETDDDIWHLYNIIEVGDLVTASTVRREEKAGDKIRAERAEKRRMTLGIRVEKVEFSEDDVRLRILGVIESGPQDIGQHHTLMAEVGERMTISKRHWKEQARPEPAAWPEGDLSQYDRVYLAYPNYCGTMPMAVKFR